MTEAALLQKLCTLQGRVACATLDRHSPYSRLTKAGQYWSQGWYQQSLLAPTKCIGVTYFAREFGFSINEGAGPANVHMSWNTEDYYLFIYIFVLDHRWYKTWSKK